MCEVLRAMPGEQLAAVFEGRPDLTPALFLRNVRFDSSATAEERGWFADAVAALDRPTLLSFITELRRLNEDGSLAPCSDPRDPKHILVKFDGRSSYPKVSTCIYQLTLPHYATREQLIEQLRLCYTRCDFSDT